MIAAITLAGVALVGPMDDDTPKELGAVDWQRKLEPALAESGRSAKPVLLLFQEIPG